ncbi:MAG: hypothetical protein MUF64_13465 [Polyangiaceae bacterium]|jgi:hypothetical protein|nr:hypothetical protein [Polyangiaceae bacterium]
MRPGLLPLLLLAAACDRPSPPAPSAAASAAPSAATSTPAIVAPAPAPLDAKAAKFLEDLNHFCVATREVKEDSSIPQERQATEIVGRLVASKPGPEFLGTLRGLSELPSGEQRYVALKKAAAERGATHWSCPALRE